MTYQLEIKPLAYVKLMQMFKESGDHVTTKSAQKLGAIEFLDTCCEEGLCRYIPKKGMYPCYELTGISKKILFPDDQVEIKYVTTAKQTFNIEAELNEPLRIGMDFNNEPSESILVVDVTDIVCDTCHQGYYLVKHERGSLIKYYQCNYCQAKATSV